MNRFISYIFRNVWYNNFGDYMKKIKLIIVSIVILLSLIGCDSKLELYKETTFDVGFNTPFSLMLYTESEDEFLKYFEFMKEEVREYNALFDIYKDYEGYNNLKTINDNAGIAPVVVDEKIIELLNESKKWSLETNDLFNPTLGPVLKIWHHYREIGISLNQEGEYGKSPSIDELMIANQYVGWDFVEINEEESTVYLNNEHASLDVGAIAKGWTVEKIADALEEQGVISGIVNGGGNVRLINEKYDGKDWSVGVTNPNAINDSSLLSLKFDRSMSVVTSGDYERFFIDDQGRAQNHLINPKTLEPARYSRSVTVTVKDSGLADILSTCFSMVTLEEAKAFENSLNMYDLGLIFVKEVKEDRDFDYNYMEVDGLHIYYNDVIKNNIK